MRATRRRTSRRAAVLAVAAAALLVHAGVAHAQQDDTPVVIGKQEKLPTFGLAPPHGAIEFLSTYARDSGSGGAGGDTKTTELRFDETLTLQTTGYVVHPNFLRLDLLGEFGLRQDKFDSDEGQDQRENSILYFWNAQAAFFEQQPISLLLYTDRTENIVDRSFAESFTNTYTTYGALLTTRKWDLPSTFRLYRTEQTQSAIGGAEDFTLNDNVFEWHTEAKPTRNQFLTWDYRVNQTEQSSANGTSEDTTGQSASLSHSLAFGPAGRHSLASTFIYSDSTGDFGIERYHLDERLRLKHTEDFRTEYEYIFDQQQSETIDQTQHRATAEFYHQLYESLFTHGEVGYLQLDVGDDGGGTRDLFGNLDFDYTKKVPYGQLLGELKLAYNVRKTSESSQPTPVVDQPFTFAGFQPIFIAGQTVDPGSIQIEDATGRIFVQGLDYTVTPRANGVEIDRVIGGAIPADSTVLVDYLLQPLPDTDINTGAFGLSLRYDILEGALKGLSPYVRFALIDQSVEGGGGLIQPNDVFDYVVGVEYRKWDFDLTAEYEVYDSTLAPFDATRLIARYDHRVSGDTVVNALASYVLTNYTDLDEKNTTINAGINVTHRLTRELLGSASVNYVDVDDSAGGHTVGHQEALELRWRHRQVEVFGRVRNSQTSTDDQDTSFQFFEMGIRREF